VAHPESTYSPYCSGQEQALAAADPDNMKNLFIRTVKTGGTSLSSAFDKHVIEVAPSYKHLKIFGKHSYDYRFTFVRNPYDRIVSAYIMLTKSRVAKDFYRCIDRNEILDIPFTAFLRKVIDYRNAYREIGLKKMNDIHLRPRRRSHWTSRNRFQFEVYWVLAHTESMVDSIEFFMPLDELDYVGRFESLESDFEYISRKVGAGQKLPLLNASTNRGRYFEYYDDESTELVTEMYRKDIETFDYAFIQHMKYARP
jgi:hypothetical protein